MIQSKVTIAQAGHKAVGASGGPEWRELGGIGRIQIRTADLLKAQLAVLEALACGAAGCIAIAEQHVSRCQERLRQAALALDRVLVERGDDEGRRRLVAGALRMAAGADAGVDASGSERPCQDQSDRGMD